MEIICIALNLYVLALLARILLSWFPISPESPVASVFSVLYTITEPVLGPVRNIMPSVGMLDLSPIVVFLGISIVTRAIGCGGGLF